MYKAWLCLLFLSPTSLWAEPTWRNFEPAGEGFRCQLPPGQLNQPHVLTGRQWMLVSPAQYAFQVGYAKPGKATDSKVFISTTLKSTNIHEILRRNITYRGLSGVEVTGTISNAKKTIMPVRLRMFASKDRVYTLNAIVLKPADAGLADRFFTSFQLTGR